MPITAAAKPARRAPEQAVKEAPRKPRSPATGLAIALAAVLLYLICIGCLMHILVFGFIVGLCLDPIRTNGRAVKKETVASTVPSSVALTAVSSPVDADAEAPRQPHQQAVGEEQEDRHSGIEVDVVQACKEHAAAEADVEEHAATETEGGWE